MNFIDNNSKKVMIYGFIILIIISSFDILAITKRERVILKVLNQEIQLTKRLVSKSTNKSRILDLKRKLFELHLEKLKIVRVYENEQYLKVPIKKRHKTKKTPYFPRSLKLLNIIENYGKETINLTKSRKEKANILLQMAEEARQLTLTEKALTYYLLSYKFSPANSREKRLTQIQLANYHYNKKNYDKTISLLEEVLKTNYKFWPREAITLGWSYYLIKKYNQALTLMEMGLVKSSQKEYTDHTERILKDIALFYADSKSFDRMFKLFLPNTKRLALLFHSLADNLVKANKADVLNQLVQQALTRTNGANNKLYLYMAFFDIFIEYSLPAIFNTTVGELLALGEKNVIPLNQQLKLKIKNLTLEMLGKTQTNRSAENSENLPMYKYAQLVPALLSKAAYLSKGTEKIKYRYLEAEHYYKLKHYEKAFVTNIKNINDCYSQKCEKTLFNPILTSTLALLGEKEFQNEKMKKDNTLFIYNHYINVNPNEASAIPIYVRLFNLYWTKNQLDKSMNTIFLFQKNQPDQIDKKQKMLAKQIDKYQSSMNVSKILEINENIKTKDIIVDDKFKNLVQKTADEIRLKEISIYLSKDNKKLAIEKYVAMAKDSDVLPIYQKDYTVGLLVLYYQAGEILSALSWANFGLKILSPKEINKNRDNYLAIIVGLFIQGHFKLAHQLSFEMLKIYCTSKVTLKNDFYYYYFLGYQYNDPNIDIGDFLSWGDKCQIPDTDLKKIIAETSQILEDSANEKKSWELISDKAKQYYTKNELYDFLYEQIISQRDEDKKAFFKEKLESFLADNDSSSISKDRFQQGQTLFNIDELENDLNKLLEFKFPLEEEKFNEQLKVKVQELAVFYEKSTNLLKLGDASHSLKIFLLNMRAYQQIVVKINSAKEEIGKLILDLNAELAKNNKELTNEKLKPEEINTLKSKSLELDDSIKSKQVFLKTLGLIEQKLKGKEYEFQQQGNDIIVKNTIFTEYNQYFTLKFDQMNGLFNFSDKLYLMDRWGIK